MSRRKLHWKNAVRQAGDVEKVIPKETKGRGEWLTQSEPEGRSWANPGNKGSNVTASMSNRKEKLVRQWAK